jgi:hypothetical protein
MLCAFPGFLFGPFSELSEDWYIYFQCKSTAYGGNQSDTHGQHIPFEVTRRFSLILLPIFHLHSRPLNQSSFPNKYLKVAFRKLLNQNKRSLEWTQDRNEN